MLDPFVKPLAQALACARGMGRVIRSAEADALWASEYAYLARSRPGAWGRATDRARPQVARLALVYALLDGAEAIGVQHLRAALALWAYAEESARLIFGDEEGTPREQEVYAMLCRSPGISRSEIYNGFNRNVPMKELLEALASLRDRGRAFCRMMPTRGRSAESWYPYAEAERKNAGSPADMGETSCVQADAGSTQETQEGSGQGAVGASCVPASADVTAEAQREGILRSCVAPAPEPDLADTPFMRQLFEDMGETFPG